MNISHVKRLLLAATALASVALTACNDDEGDKVFSPELGAVVEGNTYTVAYTSGFQTIDVFASQPYTATVTKGSEWVRLGTSNTDTDHSSLALSGDGVFVASFDRNDGVRRMATIELVAENRTDIIYIKQQGRIDTSLELSDRYMLVEQQGGEYSTLLKSNVDYKLLTVVQEYGENATSKDWISNVRCVNNTLKFDVTQNPDPDNTRKAKIMFEYVDDWDETISTELTVTQDRLNSIKNNIMTFAQMRAAGARDITEDVCVEGYVVSDVTYGNAGPNTPITSMRIDYTGTKRIVCIESTDGRYGFQLEFKTTEDNILHRYDKVTLNLNGSYFGQDGSNSISEKDPIRYYINELTAENIIAVESGSAANIPQKEMYFNELTDNDMYTYVTLKDCEFPVKKGPLTPLNEGYTGGGVGTRFSANRISQYPILLRDAQGNSFFAITNTTCTYRRDGQQLPYGSGNFSGVVVHEACDRFEWDSAKQLALEGQGYSLDQIYNLGNIGRYQLRHQSKSDIAMQTSVSNSLTKVICEFAYFNQTRNDVEKNVDAYDVMYYPSLASSTAKLYHSAGSVVTILNGWYYLGDSYNTAACGIGVSDANGVQVAGQQISYAESTSAGGRGNITDAYGAAWYAGQWIDGASYCYWYAEFSTAAVSAGQHLSAQFAVCNRAIGAPRYWNVEWSTDKNDWQYVSSYTIPDVAQWGYTAYWQLCGHKYVNVELPDAMAGYGRVYLRLIPASSNAGETNTYDNGTAGDKSSELSYFAVRYTK